jgi:hypothetical protein
LRSLPPIKTLSRAAFIGTSHHILRSKLAGPPPSCPARRYNSFDTPYPGQLHSTGTEDEFLSSYYFDLGPFESKTAGLLYATASHLHALFVTLSPVTRACRHTALTL